MPARAAPLTIAAGAGITLAGMFPFLPVRNDAPPPGRVPGSIWRKNGGDAPFESDH